MEQKKNYEPWEELPESNLKKINAITDAMHKATDSMEYNLATDTIKVPGQNWACVSFVSPTSNQKTKSLGMKIRGIFDTNSEAVDYVKRLIRLDPTFDIFICEMYNWCLIPPDPEHITDQVYQNEELNKLVSEYNKNRIYAKEHFEERKREMMEQASDEAKKAALQRLKDEAENPPNYTYIIGTPSIAEENENETEDPKIVEIVDDLIKTKINDFVSASELMDSMVNGDTTRNHCC